MITWHTNCNDVKNLKLSSWLKDSSSTCCKLQNHSLTLEVLKAEYVDLWQGVKLADPGFLRTSVLQIDKHPWMFAEALLLNGTSLIIDLISSDRFLGSWLFNSNWQRWYWLPRFD